jgi:hypothetical protein
VPRLDDHRTDAVNVGRIIGLRLACVRAFGHQAISGEEIRTEDTDAKMARGSTLAPMIANGAIDASQPVISQWSVPGVSDWHRRNREKGSDAETKKISDTFSQSLPSLFVTPTIVR